jgi:hypothetical protein
MAKLRKVFYVDRATGQGYEVWFHCFTKDGTAVVEDAAGQVKVVEAASIRFTDRALSTEFGGTVAIPPASAARLPTDARRRLPGRGSR